MTLSYRYLLTSGIKRENPPNTSGRTEETSDIFGGLKELYHLLPLLSRVVSVDESRLISKPGNTLTYLFIFSNTSTNVKLQPLVKCFWCRSLHIRPFCVKPFLTSSNPYRYITGPVSPTLPSQQTDTKNTPPTEITPYKTGRSPSTYFEFIHLYTGLSPSG